MVIGIDAGVSIGRGRGPSGPPLSEQVEAILSGTTGFALDPSDTTRLAQNSDGTGVVSAANEPIGRICSKWGTTTYDFVQTTSGARPLWDGVAGIDFDGTDDRLTLANSNLARNVASFFAAMRGKFDLWAVNALPLFISTNSAANPRFAIGSDTTRNIVLSGRSTDGSGTRFATSATGLVTAGVPTVLSGAINYAVGGTMLAYQDGSQVLSNTLVVSNVNTADTASVHVSLGAGNAANWMNGKIGRVVMCPFIPSPEQRATIAEWINEVAL